jgi:hypothetical protein
MDSDEVEAGSEPKLPELKLGMEFIYCRILVISFNEHISAV